MLHLNIQSIRNTKNNKSKIIEFESLVKNINPHLISLNETFLKTKDNFDLENFQIIRSDRQHGKGGGSALCIGSNIKGKEIPLHHLLKKDDASGFLMEASESGQIAVFSIYNPPNELINLDLWNFIIKNYKNFIIMGDLNAKSNLWHNKSENKNGKDLEQLILQNNLFVLNCPSPTFKRGNSTIDLTICSNSLRKYSSKHKVLDLSISDHQPTITSFNKITPKKEKKSFILTNWPMFQEILENQEEPFSTIQTPEEIDKAVKNFTSKICNAKNQASKQILVYDMPKGATTIPAFILNMIKEKRKIKRKINKNKTDELKKKYNSLNRKIKIEIDKFRIKQQSAKFDQLKNFYKSNKSAHWNKLKSITQEKTHTKNNTVFNFNGKFVSNDKEIADIFAENLSATFGNSQKIINHNEKSNREPAYKFEINITFDEFKQSLDNLNKKAAPGDDGISNKLLKSLPISFQLKLLEIFNASLEFSHFPDSWKMARVSMIRKKKQPKAEFKSYRPISLLNCAGKLLEKIINVKLSRWAEENKIFPSTQSGFRRKKSCQDQILRLNQQIITGFNKKQKTTAVFFDLEKAFDKASHEGIILRLKQLNLDQKMIDWIKNYLSNRLFYVTWNGKSSSSHGIKCGVPQGSSLSPTLFNLFFSSIAQSIPPEVKHALFADDLSIWFSSNKKKQSEKTLQNAIDKIVEFCKSWNLSINKSKTNYTVFTTGGYRKNYEKKHRIKLYLNGNEIELDPFPTFLGIKLDPKLSFCEHYKSLIIKTIPLIHLIKKFRSFRWANSKLIGTKIFKCLIRPLFDYAFIITLTSTQKFGKKLQIFQNNILRTIKHFPIKTKVATIHKELKIDNLSDRALHLFKRYCLSRTDHETIRNEFLEFESTITESSRFITPFDIAKQFF